MNLPNKLTMVRIALVPLVVIVYLCIGDNFWVMDETSGLAFRDVLVFIIFATASITDMLDGMIARKYHLITSFGKFVDPIADKLLVNTVLIMLACLQLKALIARDLFVDGLRMTAASQGKVVSAGFYGKLKTVLQMVAIVFLLLKNWPFSYLGLPVDQILLWAATLASLYSGYIYFMKLKKYILESM